MAILKFDPKRHKVFVVCTDGRQEEVNWVQELTIDWQAGHSPIARFEVVNLELGEFGVVSDEDVRKAVQSAREIHDDLASGS